MRLFPLIVRLSSFSGTPGTSNLTTSSSGVSKTSAAGSHSPVTSVPETLGHLLSDAGRADLALGALLQHLLDLVGHLLERGGRDGPLLARLAKPSQDLVAVVRLARAVLLDHHVRNLVDALVGRET